MNRQLAKQYFERAEASLAAGKPEDALALLNQLDEAFPNTKNIGVARARSYAAMGRVSEAVHLCDRLIELHDSRRAREMKDRLLQGSFESDAVRPVASSARNGRLALKWLAAAGLIGVIAWSANRILSNLDFASGEENAPQTSAASRTRDGILGGGARSPGGNGQLASLTRGPGFEHARFTWELDDAGVPKWKSGVFRRVPCINEPKRTINVYLPLAYDENPKALFPGVIVASPGGNPDFLGLESWAERQEVILIGLNSSRNGPGQNNVEAQDAALETITPTMRVDQRLGFAIGMSGAAMASWLVASRYPDNFRGVVMMGQGGFEDRMLAPHIRVAYIRGYDEPNNWYIPRVIRKLRENGNEVRDQFVPGGHVKGPLEVRVKMLDWMVNAARRDLRLPLPSR